MSRSVFAKSAVSALRSGSRLAGVVVAAATLSALISAPTFAQSLVTFSLVGIPGTQTIGVSTDGTNYYERAVGRYQATADGVAYNVFCVDILHPVGLNEPFQANVNYNLTDAAGPLVGNYYNGGLASALNGVDYQTYPTPAQAAARSSQVAWLADSFLNADTATFTNGFSMEDNLAAISLSIWDINQDGGDGLGVGNLRVDAASQARLGGLVAYYQDQARQNSNYVSSTAKWVQAPRSADGTHAQDFTYSTKPIPEAGTLALIGMIAAPAVPLATRRLRRKA